MSIRGYGTALAFAALLLTAACSAGSSSAPAAAPPPSPSPSAPAPVVPQVGQSYDRPFGGEIMTPEAVDCAKDHQVEIAHVGQLTGGRPLGPGSADLAPADAECRAKTAAYLGTPLGRRGLTYELAQPAAADWDRGPHWFACEVVAVDFTPGDPKLATVQTAFAAGRGTPAPRCFTLSAAHDLNPADCAQPHSAEYVGAPSAAYNSPMPKNGDDPAMTPFQVACRDEIAAEMGVTAKKLDDTWGYNFWVAKNLAPAGASVAQCYFVLWSGKTITGSIFATKGKNIPKG
ncbi:septum formation family protein [Dactylosporangium sp. NPDC051541]|uniref:septum formation family protein n=1 Tax=Dactylosporangium sp. NPDC051541 TaxID=3363977 RepID=UPI00378ADF18